MKKIVLILCLCLPFVCNAEQKIFLNKTTGLQITDVSGNKTLEEIKTEFGEASYETMVIDETKEATRVKDNKLEKYNFIEEGKAEKAAELVTKNEKIVRAKAILNVSDKDWDDLKEALK